MSLMDFLFVFLWLCCVHLSTCKINDIHRQDSFLIRPYVQKIRNYRSKDYLVELLKRNMERKRIRQAENPKCLDCTCNCPGHPTKRCGDSPPDESPAPIQDSDIMMASGEPQEGEVSSDFACEREGSFPDPKDCQKFFICYHHEPKPIEVECPRGFAFDSGDRKCTRKAARKCRQQKWVRSKFDY